MNKEDQKDKRRKKLINTNKKQMMRIEKEINWLNNYLKFNSRKNNQNKNQKVYKMI